MIISNSKQFIFIHVHKCAGSTITALLSKHTRWNDIELGVTPMGEALQAPYKERFGLHKHSGAKAISEVLGKEVFDGYFKFGFVRNPLNRVISFYTFIKKMNASKSPETQAMINGWPINQAFNESQSFSEFIRHSEFCEPPMYRLLAYPNQPQDGILIDFVGKVEQFDTDIKVVLDRIGIPLPETIERRNQSSDLGDNLRRFYRSEEDIIFVYEKYQIDFEIFSYSLEDALAEWRT